MIYQRNVLASFDTRQQANFAAQRLMQAGIGDAEVRILPPVGAHQPGGPVIVSVIAPSERAQIVERILGDYGHVDLVDQRERRRGMGEGRRDVAGDVRWSSHADRPRAMRDWRTQEWRRPSRLMQGAQSGTMMGALAALGTGLALWYGMKQWGGPGQQSRRIERWPVSGYDNRRGVSDEAGSGRQRLREWRENGAMEGIDTGVADAGQLRQRAASAPARSGEPHTMQTGIGSGSGMTAGLGEAPRDAAARRAPARSESVGA